MMANEECAPFALQSADVLTGRLEAHEAAAFHAHLSTCPACREAFEEARGTAQVLNAAFSDAESDLPKVWSRVVRTLEDRATPRPPAVWGPLVAAAAMALLALGLWYAAPSRQIRVENQASANDARNTASQDAIDTTQTFAFAIETDELARAPQAPSVAEQEVQAAAEATEVAASPEFEPSVPFQPPAPEHVMLVAPYSPTPAHAAVSEQRLARTSYADAGGLVLLRCTGPAAVFDAERHAWRGLVAGEQAPYGARFRTGAEAQAELAFGESRLRLDANSELRVLRGEAERTAELAQGRLRVDLLRSERAFKIRAGGGEVTLTGTIVEVEAPAPQVAFARVLEGHVQIASRLGEATRTFKAAAGQEALLGMRAADLDLSALPAGLRKRAALLANNAAKLLPFEPATARWDAPLDAPPARHQASVGMLVVKDEDGREAEPLTIAKLDVLTHLHGPEALTRVDQTFRNNTDRTLEGTFYFPLPPGAAISRFAMYVDDAQKTLIEGEVVERQYARTVYESILHAKRDPALLEWMEGNLFKARIFPISPRGLKRVILEYTQLLPACYDTRRYVFPLVSELTQKRPIEELVIRVEAETGDGTPFERLASPTHGSPLEIGTKGSRASAALRLYNHLPRSDFVLNLTAPRAGELWHAAYAGENERPYWLFGYQPRVELPAAEQKPRDVLFVAETSGARTPDDLDRQTQVLSALWAGLDSGKDRVAFGSADVGFTSLQEDFLPAYHAELRARLAELHARAPLGALDLGAVLRDAAEWTKARAEAGRERLIVFVGAGIPALGEIENAPLVDRGAASLRAAKARWVGIGLGRQVDHVVLTELARKSGGFYVPLKADENLAEAAFTLAMGLSGVRIESPQIRDAQERLGEVYPAQLGALLPGHEVFLHARGQESAGEAERALLVTGEIGEKTFENRLPYELPPSLGLDPAIGRFWARARLDHLLAQPQDEPARRKIVDLAQTWTLMSPYTSFLVLESNQDYARYGIDRAKRRRIWRDPRQEIERREFQVAEDADGNLLSILKSMQSRQGEIAFVKRGTALVVTDTRDRLESIEQVIKATGDTERGKALYEDFRYEAAREHFERALKANPEDKTAQEAIDKVNALRGLRLERAHSRILDLDRNQRVRIQDTLVRVAQDIQELAELEKRAAAIFVESSKEKTQILQDQMESLISAREKARRVIHTFDALPFELDLSSERRDAEGSLRRIDAKIREKEDEITHTKRLQAQKIAEEQRLREQERFKERQEDEFDTKIAETREGIKNLEEEMSEASRERANQFAWNWTPDNSVTQEEYARLKRKVEELRKKLPPLTEQDRMGWVDEHTENRFGPPAKITTNKLTLGGVAQVWNYRIEDQNDYVAPEPEYRFSPFQASRTVGEEKLHANNATDIELEIYDIRDLTSTIPDFPGPRFGPVTEEPPSATSLAIRDRFYASPDRRTTGYLLGKRPEWTNPHALLFWGFNFDPINVNTPDAQVVRGLLPVKPRKPEGPFTVKELIQDGIANEELTDLLTRRFAAEFSDARTSLQESGGKLVVMQNAETHKRIAHALENLREAFRTDYEVKQGREDLAVLGRALRVKKDAIARLEWEAAHLSWGLLANRPIAGLREVWESTSATPRGPQSNTWNLALRDTQTASRSAVNDAEDLKRELEATRRAYTDLARDKAWAEEDLRMQTRRIESLLANNVPVWDLLDLEPKPVRTSPPPPPTPDSPLRDAYAIMPIGGGPGAQSASEKERAEVPWANGLQFSIRPGTSRSPAEGLSRAFLGNLADGEKDNLNVFGLREASGRPLPPVSTNTMGFALEKDHDFQAELERIRSEVSKPFAPVQESAEKPTEEESQANPQPLPQLNPVDPQATREWQDFTLNQNVKVAEGQRDHAAYFDRFVKEDTKPSPEDKERIKKLMAQRDLIEESKHESAPTPDEIAKLKGVILTNRSGVVAEDSAEMKEMERELNRVKQHLAQMRRDKRQIEEDLDLQTRRVETLLANNVPVWDLLSEDPEASQPYIPAGVVLQVRPELNLVMLSLGRNQGVHSGYRFTICRGDRYIAKAKALRVYPDMSSATLLLKKDEVQVNDEVRSRITGGNGKREPDVPKDGPEQAAKAAEQLPKLRAELAKLPRDGDADARRADLHEAIYLLVPAEGRFDAIIAALEDFQWQGAHAERVAQLLAAAVKSEASLDLLASMLPKLKDAGLRAIVLRRCGELEKDPAKRLDLRWRAYNESPGDPEGLRLLADALLDAGKSGEAVELLQKELRAGRGANWMWTKLAELYAARHDAAGELRARTQDVALRPREHEPRRNLALCLEQAGKLSEALREIKLASAFRPESAELLLEVARLARQASNVDEEEAALLKLTEHREDGARSQAASGLRERIEARRKAGQNERAAELRKRLDDAVAVDFVATLTWNTDQTDLDLHVLEPGERHVYYSDRNSLRGGSLDRDIQNGHGPETYTIRRLVPGEYRVWVRFYGGARTPTTATLKLTFGKDGSQECTQTFTFELENPGSESAVLTFTNETRSAREAAGNNK